MKGWSVLAAMLFAGIIAVMNQFEVPMFMNALTDEFFKDSPGDAGWLMSVIAIAAIIIAYPSAFLMDRFSPKTIGACGLGVMVIGATLGAAALSAPVLIFGRILQGTGVAIMGIVATTIIAMYFPREKAGLPLGIWNLWYTGGATLAYNIGIPVAIAFTGSPDGWHAWFWFCDVAALAAFIVFCIFVRIPLARKTIEKTVQDGSSETIFTEGDSSTRNVPSKDSGLLSQTDRKVCVANPSDPSSCNRNTSEAGKSTFRESWMILKEGFKVSQMWILGISFGCLMFTSLCILSWVPTYVQDIETAKLVASGMSDSAAAIKAGTDSGSMASIGFASSIPMSFVTAWLLGRFTSLKARKMMLVIASLMGFLYCFAFLVPFDWLPWWLVLLGIESGWTSGVVWSLVPVTMPKAQTISVGMATVIFFQGLSNLLSTPVVGYVIGASDNWGHVSVLTACTACAGVALCIYQFFSNSGSQSKSSERINGMSSTGVLE